MKCKHCLLDFEGSKSQFANHVRWCDKNPKQEQYKLDNSNRGKNLGNARFGAKQSFEVVCASCEKTFNVVERELLFPSKRSYFCSKKCSNSVGGKAKAAKYHYDEVASYTTVAWRHHERKCLVCGEDNIVAAHHLDENHDNNDPKNLVPLCPTHHQYWHSKFRELIQEKVSAYILEKWGNNLPNK